mgnify:CR=1 FL=1
MKEIKGCEDCEREREREGREGGGREREMGVDVML